MAHFNVNILTPRGKQATVEVDAKDVKDATRKASSRGRVLSVRRKRNFTFGGMTFGERQVFLSRFSAMLASRVGGGDALRLIRDTFSGNIRKVAHQLLIKVESGSDIPSAIAEVGTPHFPDNVVAMIVAGAQSGETWRALQESMKFEQQMAYIRKGSTRGIGGAMFGILFAAGFIIAARFYMYPKLMKGPLSQLGKGAIHIGWATRMTAYVGYAMIGVVVVLSLLFLLATVGRKIMPRFADKLILAIPFYKDMILSRNNYIAFYGLSLLVSTGVRLRDSIGLTARSMPRGALRSDMEKAEAAIGLGKPWATSLRSLHETDRAALASALDSEQMARSLEAIARQYMSLYEQRIASFVPAIQLLAGAFVILGGLIMFTLVILPMLQVMQHALH